MWKRRSIENIVKNWLNRQKGITELNVNNNCDIEEVITEASHLQDIENQDIDEAKSQTTKTSSVLDLHVSSEDADHVSMLHDESYGPPAMSYHPSTTFHQSLI